MHIMDKLLLAVLKTVPKEQEELLVEDFEQELEKMGVLIDTPIYQFLFNNNLVAIHESGFMTLKGSNSDLRIKTTNSIRYVYLTDLGQVVLWSLQSDYIREQFQELKQEVAT